MEPIQISFTPTAQDYIQSERTFFLRRFQPRAALVISILFAVAAIYVLARGWPAWITSLLLFLIGMVGPVGFAIYLIVRALRRDLAEES